MVDVGHKADTQREAIARGRVLMKPETLVLIQEEGIKKGDVLAVAQIAGRPPNRLIWWPLISGLPSAPPAKRVSRWRP
jgi:hypothetical protein